MRAGANDGPRMSPINSAPNASPDVAFRDDCHVGLALTIDDSKPKIATEDQREWLKSRAWRAFPAISTRCDVAIYAPRGAPDVPARRE